MHYTAGDVETAAKIASGCNAQFSAGILAFLGGFNPATANLQEISAKVKDFKGWNAELSC